MYIVYGLRKTYRTYSLNFLTTCACFLGFFRGWGLMWQIHILVLVLIRENNKLFSFYFTDVDFWNRHCCRYHDNYLRHIYVRNRMPSRRHWRQIHIFWAFRSPWVHCKLESPIHGFHQKSVWWQLINTNKKSFFFQ